MISHHTGDKLDAQWEETFVNLIQSFSKISKKYLMMFGNQREEGKSKDIFKKVFDSLYFVMRLTEREVFIEAIKALKVILSSEVA